MEESQTYAFRGQSGSVSQAGQGFLDKASAVSSTGIDAVQFPTTGFDLLRRHPDAPPRPVSWDELLATYAHKSGTFTPKHSLVNCLPSREWGKAFGINFVRSLSSSAPEIQTSFTTLEPGAHPPSLMDWTSPHSNSAPTERIVVVHILGYRPWEEILQLFKETNKANKDGESVSLLILSYIPLHNWQRFLRHNTAVYDVKTLRLNVSHRFHCLPSGLEGVYYPLSSILRRREYEPVYGLAEQQALDRLELVSCSSLTEQDQLRVMFEAVKGFVNSALGQGEDYSGPQLLALAQSWTFRLGQEGEQSVDSRDILYSSGLFVPEKNGHEIVPQPVAGVISAYLQAVDFCSENSEKRRLGRLRQRLVTEARSRRSLSISRYRHSTEVTAWLALMMSAYFAKTRTANQMINAVARIDLSIALDMHASRNRDYFDRNIAGNTTTEKMFSHGHEHGNSVPVQYVTPLDRAVDRRRPVNPDLNRSTADTSRARALFRSVPDLDLLATLLASCAIPGDKPLSDPDLWRGIVPSLVTEQLRVLGESFRRNSIQTRSGTRVSVDVLKIEDLKPIFPNIGRITRHDHHVLEFSWLTAYVAALGCGAHLPSQEELMEIFDDRRLQENCLGIKEVSGNSRGLQALARFEWLRQPASGMLSGADFVGTTPRLFHRSVSKAYVFRRSSHQPQKCHVSFGVRVTAEPGRTQLAACRLAFLPDS